MYNMLCKICSSPMTQPVPELFALPSVTSDCRPWKAGRSVAICPNCGVMERALRNVPEFGYVYDDYKMFDHAGGADQINFSGTPEGRTSKILKFISDKISAPSLVLDIGCGSGAGLMALHDIFPKAYIYGFDRGNISIPTMEKIYFSNTRPDGKFDLITLFHVFEHIEDLHEILSYIKSALAAGGHVLIQVPYIATGAFDLVIADHIWHFSMKSLMVLMNACDLSPIYIGNDCIKKEITLLAKAGNPKTLAKCPPEVSHEAINWLLRYKDFLDGINESVAIYGSGPAAAWAGGILGDKVIMYVDDDQCRVGAQFNGKPIKSREWLDKKLPVVAPFPDWQLQQVMQKNNSLNFLYPKTMELV